MPSRASKREILRAAALKYREDMEAPMLTAYGEGRLAQQMVELAQRNGLHISDGEADELLEALKHLPVNAEIPPDLYLAVARIYAYFYRQR